VDFGPTAEALFPLPVLLCLSRNVEAGTHVQAIEWLILKIASIGIILREGIGTQYSTGFTDTVRGFQR
jgi:hypothetical protein